MMNQEPSWGELVQNGDGNFDDFLAEVNVGDLNDIDFTDFEVGAKDNGMLTFEEAAAASADGGLDLVNGKRNFGIPTSHPDAQTWTGQAGAAVHPAFLSPGTMQADQFHQTPPPLSHPMHHAHPHHQHMQYGTVPRQMAVPPTPNSLEMHGQQPSYLQGDAQHARAVYESYARKQQEQVG